MSSHCLNQILKLFSNDLDLNSNYKIAEIQDIYRIIFQSGMIYSKACDVVEQTIPQSPERDEILNFIRTSKRGILKPYNSRRNSEDLD